MSITLFALPKEFRGHTGLIQRNAVRSWAALRPRAEVLLFGDEDGTAAMAHEAGARHLPLVARAPSGVPLVGPMFAEAQRAASHRLLCYVNSDIILPQAFMDAVAVAARQPGNFLVVGRRWLLDVAEELDVGPGFQERLKARLSGGWLDRHTAVDYFLFPKGTYASVPPFAIGRFTWDNWLVGHVRDQCWPVLDATPTVQVVHQNHDYAHAGGTRNAAWGEDAMRNRSLAGGTSLLTIADCTHVIARGRVRPALGPLNLWRRAETSPALGGPDAPLRRAMRAAWRAGRRFRREHEV